MKLRTLRSVFFFMLLVTACAAAPVTWQVPATSLAPLPWSQPLQGVAVEGWFSFDYDTESYTDWQFLISGHDETTADMNATLSPENSAVLFGNRYGLELGYGGVLPSILSVTPGYLYMGTSFVHQPISPAGALTPVLVRNISPRTSFTFSYGGSFSFGSFSFPSGVELSATNVITAVPEPVTGVLVLVSAAALCLMRSRKVVGK
ncbi:MAG TPA: hypothetical protein VES20_18965 [Bryobacteraceae bacterium]|nr:hypothetical protein [Bryobacteraceae bacterium]